MVLITTEQRSKKTSRCGTDGSASNDDIRVSRAGRPHGIPMWSRDRRLATNYHFRSVWSELPHTRRALGRKGSVGG